MLEIDACGVCGGHGLTATACNATELVFAWREKPLSHCSSPCGGGQMMAHSVCVNEVSGAEVDGDLCDAALKTPPRMAPCNQQACPAR